MSYITNKGIADKIKKRKYSIGDIVIWTWWYPDENYDPAIQEYTQEFIGVIIDITTCDIPPDFKDVETFFTYGPDWRELTLLNQDGSTIRMTEEYIKEVL